MSDIIRKIKGALRIAEDDSASDGEIQAAMNAVHKMMDKHHLTEADLAHEPANDYQVVNEAAYGRFRVTVGRKIFGWEGGLAYFVSKFVGVPSYIDHSIDYARENGIIKRDSKGEAYIGKSIVFYGLAEDAKIARELYAELRQIISTLAVAKYDTVYTGDGGVYSEGFVSGLTSQMNQENETKRIEAQASSTSTAMVLVERRDDLMKYKWDAAEKYLKEEIGVKTRKGRNARGARGDHNAYHNGRTDGKNMEVSKSRSKKIGMR